MKGRRKVCRQLVTHPDAQRRWDRAYQHRLEWTAAHPPSHPPSGSAPLLTQEEAHESRPFCPRVDTETG